MNTTSSSLTKQLNYSKSSPANSSSNIHPSSTNSDLKETQPTTISTTSSFSSSEKNEAKLKEFKEYLVKSEAFLAITKCNYFKLVLVSLRNAKERPDDPLKAL